MLLTLCFATEPADAYQDGLVLLSPDSTRRPAPKGIDWHAYTGSGAPLDTPAFYTTLGREEDLVRHRRRQRNLWLASAGAIGLSTVGGALTSAYVLPEITDNGGLKLGLEPAQAQALTDAWAEAKSAPHPSDGVASAARVASSTSGGFGQVVPAPFR